MTSWLETEVKMSNTSYHKCGKPTWWARVGSGDDVKWVQIPHTRGDAYLECEVDLPPGTVVHCGAGPRQRRGVRETVTTVEIGEGQ